MFNCYITVSRDRQLCNYSCPINLRCALTGTSWSQFGCNINSARIIFSFFLTFQCCCRRTNYSFSRFSIKFQLITTIYVVVLFIQLGLCCVYLHACNLRFVIVSRIQHLTSTTPVRLFTANRGQDHVNSKLHSRVFHWHERAQETVQDDP